MSTAYYAVFHALCGLVANELLRRKDADLFETVYRGLEHGDVKRRLLNAAASHLPEDVVRIGAHFAMLQERRYDADYKGPSYLVTSKEALASLEQAEEALSLLNGLEDEARSRLAFLLAFGRRRT